MLCHSKRAAYRCGALTDIIPIAPKLPCVCVCSHQLHARKRSTRKKDVAARMRRPGVAWVIAKTTLPQKDSQDIVNRRLSTPSSHQQTDVQNSAIEKQ